MSDPKLLSVATQMLMGLAATYAMMAVLWLVVTRDESPFASQVKLTIFAASVLAFSLGAAEPEVGPIGSGSFWQWVMRESALLALVIVGAHFYRRDLKRIIEEDRQIIGTLTKLVAEAATAQQRAADITESNTEAIERLRKELQIQGARRRGLSPLADEGGL